jgi:hypothetical protein
VYMHHWNPRIDIGDNNQFLPVIGLMHLYNFRSHLYVYEAQNSAAVFINSVLDDPYPLSLAWICQTLVLSEGTHFFHHWPVKQPSAKRFVLSTRMVRVAVIHCLLCERPCQCVCTLCRPRNKGGAEPDCVDYSRP